MSRKNLLTKILHQSLVLISKSCWVRTGSLKRLFGLVTLGLIFRVHLIVSKVKLGTFAWSRSGFVLPYGGTFMSNYFKLCLQFKLVFNQYTWITIFTWAFLLVTSLCVNEFFTKLSWLNVCFLLKKRTPIGHEMIHGILVQDFGEKIFSTHVEVTPWFFILLKLQFFFKILRKYISLRLQFMESRSNEKWSLFF